MLIDAIKRSLHRFVQVQVWGMDIHPTARIDPSALIDRTWPKGIHIGAGCVVEEQAVVLTHDMTRGLYLDTRLGVGCHVAARAIIMPGMTVGDGAVVAPGAVVTRDVPPGGYAIGNPAEVREAITA